MACKSLMWTLLAKGIRGADRHSIEMAQLGACIELWLVKSKQVWSRAAQTC